MLKRFGLAGLLLAVSAVAPLTAVAQDRNYSNHNQAQWSPQAQHGVQVRDARGNGYNTAQDFRGGAYNNNAQDFRGGANRNYRDVREPARNVTVNRDRWQEPDSNFHADRDDRYSKLRYGHNHGPMPYRDSDDYRR
jgi:hypothetical protein